MPKKKKRIEYRYYDMPTGSYVLPLLGESWIREYGEGMRDMLHFHNYMEIGYCHTGGGVLIIEDREYEYRDNMFSVIPANIPHTTNSVPGTKCFWEYLFVDIEGFLNNEMHMDEMWKARVLSVINKRGTLKSEENHGVLSRIILNIIRECQEQSLFYEESIKGYLYAFVIEVMRLADERDKSRHTRRVTEYVKDALDYIDRHYMEQLRVEDLAQASGLSESHFRRVFEDSMNMKPLDYVNLVRVDKACLMMGKEDISMEELSYRVGFQTQSTFNRNFKRLTGVSPYQWKRKENGQEGVLKNYHISVMKGWES
jgi:AraC-like DNA-binding protein